jgi:hypothetical protein
LGVRIVEIKYRNTGNALYTAVIQCGASEAGAVVLWGLLLRF